MAVVGNLHALAPGKGRVRLAMHQALDVTASHLHPVCPQDGVHAGTSKWCGTVMHPSYVVEQSTIPSCALAFGSTRTLARILSTCSHRRGRDRRLLVAGRFERSGGLWITSQPAHKPAFSARLARQGDKGRFPAPKLCRNAVAQSAFRYRRRAWLPVRNCAHSPRPASPIGSSAKAPAPGAGLPFELPPLVRSSRHGAAAPV